MRIIKRGKVLSSSKAKIMAAGEDDIEYMDDSMSGNDSIGDMIDDFQVQDDFQDDTEEVIDDSEEETVEDDDVEQDDADIEIENNIANHYIAECDSCHGVFISALVETDQDVEMISGTCPLCGKDTDQYLKWIIREI